MMPSGVMMLKYLKETEAATPIQKATADVINRGDRVTHDMSAERNDPTAVGTSRVADAIIETMAATKGATA